MDGRWEKFDIKLVYLKDIPPEGVLKEFSRKIEAEGLSLRLEDQSKIPKAALSLEDFSNIIYVILSIPVIRSYLVGLMSNITYDLIKQSLIYLLNSVKGKKVSKITASEVRELDATFGVRAIIDGNTQIDFRLTGISESLQEKCIDKMFEWLKKQKNKESFELPDFATFDESEEEWKLVTFNDVVRKIRDGETKSS